MPGEKFPLSDSTGAVTGQVRTLPLMRLSPWTQPTPGCFSFPGGPRPRLLDTFCGTCPSREHSRNPLRGHSADIEFRAGAKLLSKFRPPDVAGFGAEETHLSAPEVRTNTCPAFLVCKTQPA